MVQENEIRMWKGLTEIVSVTGSVFPKMTHEKKKKWKEVVEKYKKWSSFFLLLFDDLQV